MSTQPHHSDLVLSATCGSDCDSSDCSGDRDSDHHLPRPTDAGRPVSLSAKACLLYTNSEIIQQLVHRNGKSPEDAQSIFRDCLRFLFLAGTTGQTLSPPPVIDEAWHCFILNTRAYSRFCEDYFGAFIHHSPTRQGERANNRPRLDNTLRLAKAEFGPLSGNWSIR
jgi:hypothetical protein